MRSFSFLSFLPSFLPFFLSQKEHHNQLVRVTIGKDCSININYVTSVINSELRFIASLHYARYWAKPDACAFQSISVTLQDRYHIPTIVRIISLYLDTMGLVTNPRSPSAEQGLDIDVLKHLVRDEDV
jgi:hypothetical protein